MHMTKTKFTKLLLTYLIAFYVFAEIFSLAYFYITRGEWIYNQESLPVEKRLEISNTTPRQQLTNSVLHPVLGFIWNPGLSIKKVANRTRLDLMVGVSQTPKWSRISSNNYGFFSPVDYPFRPEEDAFLIGVFGGSVAQWFSLQGADRLKQLIKDIPALRNRKIYILNFAQGAFKQPQQLLALNYFLALGQEFDLLVNIDGANEAGLAYDNRVRGYEHGMPAAQRLLPLVGLLDKNIASNEVFEAYTLLRELNKTRQTIELKILKNTRSATLELAYLACFNFVTSRYDHAAEQLNNNSSKAPLNSLFSVTELSNKNRGKNAPSHYTYLADLWMRSSQLMNAALLNKEIPYLHVIQPNQYYSQKKFSSLEERIAVHPDSTFKKAVPAVYPYLLMSAKTLLAEGVNIKDATSLFDKEAGSIYIDSCCHINQQGNELFADYIAEEINKILRSPAVDSTTMD